MHAIVQYILIKLPLSVLFLFFMTGCSAIDMRSYEANEPKLDLFKYFEGSTKGWGVVLDRSGALTRQFIVTIEGTVTDSGYLQLIEHFVWSDGERSSRTWLLQQEDDHLFSGQAEDVIGDASGTLYGNVLNWQYSLMLTIDENNWKVDFNDWMFLVNRNLLLNKAVMSKFGLKVGEVIIIFDNNFKEENNGDIPWQQ